jgi:hypothetical protein
MQTHCGYKILRPERTRYFYQEQCYFSLPPCSNIFDPFNSYSAGTWTKRPERDADHSSRSSIEGGAELSTRTL